MSRLRSLGLRVVALVAVVAALFGVRATAPRLPSALFASFDKVAAVLERQIDELEQPPAPAQRDASALLAHLDREVSTACAAAAAALDAALRIAPALTELDRAAVLACVDRHVLEARRDYERAADPDVRTEYEATHAGLVALRERLA